jgi:hypothetical protein
LQTQASDALRVSTDEDKRWEADYPHRDALVDVRRWTSLEVTRAQISAAFLIERLARAYMGGRQRTGVLTPKRSVLVDDIETVRVTHAAFAAAPPTPEAQAFIDRALGCLRQCFAHGMVVYAWEHRDYTGITDSFKSLLSFASDPNHTPLELAWEPTYLGDRPPLPPNFKPPKKLEMRVVYAIVVVLQLIVVAFLWWFVHAR